MGGASAQPASQSGAARNNITMKRFTIDITSAKKCPDAGRVLG